MTFPQLNEVAHSCENWLGNRILFLLARVVHRLPLKTALAMGSRLGQLAPRVSPRHYHRICADIAQAYGLASDAPEVCRIATESYRHLGQSLMEFLRLPYMSAEEIRRGALLEGAEHIEAALARGHGAIMLTAHIGNWEVCGTLMGLSRYPTTAIARPQNDSAITELFTRVREAHGLKVVPMTDVRECIRVLKRNECLGILGDLNARPPGAFTNVFGRPASTYLGTAYLAKMSGAAILPLFDERLPDLTHRVRIMPPIPVADTGDRQRDLLITTMRTQEVIEQEVRRRPEDWYWLLQRWKIRPEEVANPERIPMEHRDFTPEEAAHWRHGESVCAATPGSSAETPPPTA